MNIQTSGRPNGGKLLRHPSIVVFLLTVAGAVIGWGIRQEYINQHQQYQLDQHPNPVDLERRLGSIERRLERLESNR